jgi:hypothetical protein
VDSVSADLSFSAPFSRKIRIVLTTGHLLAIARILFILPSRYRRIQDKNALPCRPAFAGAVIVGRNQGGDPSARMLAGASRGNLTDPTMKKLLPSAVLAMAVCAFAAPQSFAGCFGLFYNHCGCCGCGAKFCVRQYNAFSPVCCGTVFCDGCCPFGSGGGGPGPGYGGGCGPCAGGMCPAPGCGLNFSGVPACGGGGCGDGSCLGSLPPSEPPPGAPVGNPVVAPSPLPSGPTSQAMIGSTIQNAAYRPAVAPVASSPAPVRMQPQMMAAPSYWGN